MKAPLTSRRTFIKTTALALPAIATGCAHLRGRTDEFVRVRNGRFELRGQPHFYVGANMWFGCYLSDAALPGGRQRLVRELDRLQSMGVNNIRLLAGSETSDLAAAISRGITRAPHDYDQDLLAGLDFTLAEMAKRDIRGILFVSNYWQWSGGFAQYMRWVTGETIPDPDKPPNDWHGFMQMSARLYQTPAANQLYLDYVKSLINRRNTVNGRIYRNDPAIMTWELANEPRPGADNKFAARDVPIFADWVDATARFIHEQDLNHLVCTGSEGIHGCLDSADAFAASHKTPAIDYVTVHMWLKNWKWLEDFALGDEFEKGGRSRARSRGGTHEDRHGHSEKTARAGGIRPAARSGKIFAGISHTGAGRILSSNVRAGGGILPRWPGAAGGKFLGLGRRRPRRGQNGHDCDRIHGRSVFRTAGIELRFRYGLEHTRNYHCGKSEAVSVGGVNRY